MVGSSGGKKTASTLIEEAGNAIERAHVLRIRTDSNLAWSEFLLNVVQKNPRRRLQNELVTGGSYNNLAA